MTAAAGSWVRIQGHLERDAVFERGFHCREQEGEAAGRAERTADLRVATAADARLGDAQGRLVLVRNEQENRVVIDGSARASNTLCGERRMSMPVSTDGGFGSWRVIYRLAPG